MNSLYTAFKWAWRSLRGNLSGLRIFVACLALGVGIIAAVGSVAASFKAGLATQSQEILGGDIEVSVQPRDLALAERAWLYDWAQDKGVVSRVWETRSMVRAGQGDLRSLVEVKAVDGRYPLFGQLALDKPTTGGTGAAQPVAATVIRQAGPTPCAAVDPSLLTRLGIKFGGAFYLGAQKVKVCALIDSEPDRVGAGFAFAPRVLISHETLQASNLIQTGSRVEYKYRIRLHDGVPATAFKEMAKKAFPAAPWRIRDLSDGVLGAEETIDRVSQFLTLVGLAALCVGGVGIGNGIGTYLERQRPAIATYKCLGATGGLVFLVYLMQILLLALAGIGIGVAAGALAPIAVGSLLRSVLPVAAVVAIYPWALACAALYGVLMVLCASLWPLAGARAVSPAHLFRAVVAPRKLPAGWPYILGSVAAGGGIVAVAVFSTPYKVFAAEFIGATGLVFLLLYAQARGIRRLARPAGGPLLRLALSNLCRRGSPSDKVVLSLGLGLTLFVAVALIEGNVRRQVAEEIPQRVPSFFVMDIRRGQAADFDKFVRSLGQATDYHREAMVRATLVKIDGKRPDVEKIAPDARWMVEGDRFITYRADLPAGNRVVAGNWWPATYSGPALVSLERYEADALGVGVGDRLAFNIAGREIEARLANIREAGRREDRPNFSVIFAPGSLEAAPQQNVASLRVPASLEERVQAQLSDRFPNVTIIWVKQVLEAASALLSKLAVAVKAGSGIMLVAGVLVLAGAVGAGHQARVYDAVVLKVYGARRRDLLTVYVLEFGFLGAATALVAAVAGTLAAYIVVTRVMNATWHFLPLTLALTLGAAVASTVILGLAGTWSSLGERPMKVLRARD